MKEKLAALEEKLILNNRLSYNILMSNIIINSNINAKDKELLLLLLQERDRNYVRINHNKQVYENICSYLNVLRPLDLKEELLVRRGGENDGSYVMFNGGGELKKNHNAKALSLGVSEYSPWDLEMAELGFKVIEYDASIEKSPYEHKNIVFHKKFIACHNDDLHITLEQAIKESTLDENQANILQCDIENYEWEMLESIDINLLKKYFTQVIFEFHGCNPEETDGFQQRMKQLLRLRENFVPIYTHFNNHGKIFYSRALFFSTTIEVSFVRKDLMPTNTKLKENGESVFNSPTYLPNPEIPVRFVD
ncbi:hypothetical protein OQH60_05660 [Campylobacter sp. MIT 21-1685]|uniref:hypothetical protein n=1 Tax=unclassified Campylobacter TaxID=2593542 RepID=UPI00224AE5E1|nr:MULTISPECIES: hypothetical protein [unclassified Campylobacter]MCX2683312.1 hypothetical protein [Campylobacter sp. MIT 21-1684]MCX2751632.1 hypothetical protein [Campylobacter sp. MIT 21-1682]MCX2807832.1 hypothetical protein [Campylobacter sp. MIT 21-1685]